MSRHLRVSATTGGDYLTNDGGGYGPHIGIQVEYVGRHYREAGSEYDPGNDGTHNQTTTYSAMYGSASIGAFIDGGYRWMNDVGDHAYISLGLIVRLPAGAGFADFTGQH